MTSLIGGLVIVILVALFGYDRTRQARKRGEVEGALKESNRKVEMYEDALSVLVAPDPSITDLERMSAAAAAAAGASADRLREVERRYAGGLLRSDANSKE